MKVTDPEFVDGLFPQVIQAISEPNVQNLFTVEQKQAIMDAIGVSVEEISDTHVRVIFLFMIMDVDATDENTPKINIGFDLKALKALEALTDKLA